MESNNEQAVQDYFSLTSQGFFNPVRQRPPPDMRMRKHAGKKREKIPISTYTAEENSKRLDEQEGLGTEVEDTTQKIPISTYTAEENSKRLDEQEETLLQQRSYDDSNPAIKNRIREAVDNMVKFLLTEIRSGSLADEDKEARESLIKLVDPLMYFCGAAALCGFAMNATMKQTSDDKHISGLWIVALCLLLNFDVFALIRFTLHYYRQKEITYALNKLVLLPLGFLMVLLFIALWMILVS